MKKILLAVFLVLAVSVIFANSANVFSTNDPTARWTNTFGIGFPNFGSLMRNNFGQIIGVSGFNVLLGYSQKNYFKPLKTGIFNGYWGWGTYLLIVPYVDLGVDYVMDSGFYLGGTIGLSLLFPMIGVDIGAYY